MNQRHPFALVLMFILVASLSHAAITDAPNNPKNPPTNASSLPLTVTGINGTSTNDTSTNGTSLNSTDRSLIEPDPNPNNSTDSNTGVDGGINGSEPPAADTPPVQNPAPNGTDILWPTAQGANNTNLTNHIAAIVGGTLAATAVATGAAVGIAYLVKSKRGKGMGSTAQNTFMKSQIEHLHRDGNRVDQDPRNIGQVHSRDSPMVPDHRKKTFWMGDGESFDAFHDHMGNQPLKRPEIFRGRDKNRQFGKPFGREFVARHKYGRQDENGLEAIFKSVREGRRREYGYDSHVNEVAKLIEKNRTFDRIRPRLVDSRMGYQGAFQIKTDKQRRKERNRWQQGQLTMAQSRERARGIGERNTQFEQMEDREPRYPQSQARVSFRGRRGSGDTLSLESRATFSEQESVNSQEHPANIRQHSFNFDQPRGGMGVKGAIQRGNIPVETPSVRGRFGFRRGPRVSGPGRLTGQAPSAQVSSSRGRFGFRRGPRQIFPVGRLPQEVVAGQSRAEGHTLRIRRPRWFTGRDPLNKSASDQGNVSMELQQHSPNLEPNSQQAQRGGGWRNMLRKKRRGNASSVQFEEDQENVALNRVHNISGQIPSGIYQPGPSPPAYRPHLGLNEGLQGPRQRQENSSDAYESPPGPSPPVYRLHLGLNEGRQGPQQRQENIENVEGGNEESHV